MQQGVRTVIEAFLGIHPGKDGDDDDDDDLSLSLSPHTMDAMLGRIEERGFLRPPSSVPSDSMRLSPQPPSSVSSSRPTHRILSKPNQEDDMQEHPGDWYPKETQPTIWRVFNNEANVGDLAYSIDELLGRMNDPGSTKQLKMTNFKWLLPTREGEEPTLTDGDTYFLNANGKARARYILVVSDVLKCMGMEVGRDGEGCGSHPTEWRENKAILANPMWREVVTRTIVSTRDVGLLDLSANIVGELVNLIGEEHRNKDLQEYAAEHWVPLAPENIQPMHLFALDQMPDYNWVLTNIHPPRWIRLVVFDSGIVPGYTWFTRLLRELANASIYIMAESQEHETDIQEHIKYNAMRIELSFIADSVRYIRASHEDSQVERVRKLLTKASAGQTNPLAICPYGTLIVVPGMHSQFAEYKTEYNLLEIESHAPFRLIEWTTEMAKLREMKDPFTAHRDRWLASRGLAGTSGLKDTFKYYADVADSLSPDDIKEITDAMKTEARKGTGLSFLIGNSPIMKAIRKVRERKLGEVIVFTGIDLTNGATYVHVKGEGASARKYADESKLGLGPDEIDRVQENRHTRDTGVAVQSIIPRAGPFAGESISVLICK